MRTTDTSAKSIKRLSRMERFKMEKQFKIWSPKTYIDEMRSLNELASDNVYKMQSMWMYAKCFELYAQLFGRKEVIPELPFIASYVAGFKSQWPIWL
jgi:hypothetical protein